MGSISFTQFYSNLSIFFYYFSPLTSGNHKRKMLSESQSHIFVSLDTSNDV